MQLHLTLLFATGISIALANPYYPDAGLYLRDVDELGLSERDLGHEGLYARMADERD